MHLAETTGDPAALLDAYRAQEAVLVEGPEAGRERLRLGDGTVEQATRLGQPLAAAIGHGWRLVGGVELARTDVVDDAVSRLADLTRSGGPFVRWHERRALAAVATLHGDFAAARHASAEAFALAMAAGDFVGAGMTGQLSLELAQLRGDPGELDAAHDDQLAAAPPIPVIQVARARTAVLRGAPEEAVPYYEQVMASLAAAIGDVRGRGVAFSLPDLAVALGDVDGAPRLLDALDGLPRPRGRDRGAHHVLLRLAPARPRPAGGARGAARRRRRRTCAPRSGSTWCSGPGRRPAWRGSTWRACSCPPTAATTATPVPGRRATRRAGPWPGRCSPRPDASTCRAPRPRHATCWAAPAPDGPDLGDGLTRREAEVAAMVRRGLTNREIADVLVVSERTVETHVSNVLRKTGHRNRRELLAGRPAP